MEDERSKKVAAHLSSLRERANRLEDVNLSALADICEWQQEQLDEDDGVLERCEAWTGDVIWIVNEKFAELNKLIIHDREAFEVIFKNYFELKTRIDFIQRSLEVVEAASGVDLEGERLRQAGAAVLHSPVSCICTGEITCELCAKPRSDCVEKDIETPLAEEDLSSILGQMNDWENYIGTEARTKLESLIGELLFRRSKMTKRKNDGT